jgi:hypothetical protein
VGANSAVTFLPSNVFWFGMVPGQSATFSLPRETAVANGFGPVLDAVSEGADAAAADESHVTVTITLDRIEGIKRKDKRTLTFIVAGASGKKQTFNLTLTDEVARELLLAATAVAVCSGGECGWWRWRWRWWWSCCCCCGVVGGGGVGGGGGVVLVLVMVVMVVMGNIF